MFGGRLGMPELLLILVVALIFFGPRKLPELGKSLGSALREFKKSTQHMTEEIESAVKDDPTPAAGASPSVAQDGKGSDAVTASVTQAATGKAADNGSASVAAGDKRN